MPANPNDPNNQRQPEPFPWDFDGQIPEGDNPEVTRHMAESTVGKLAAALREVVDMTEVHQDMAPATAARVWSLLLILSDEVTAWVRRWQA